MTNMTDADKIFNFYATLAKKFEALETLQVNHDGGLEIEDTYPLVQFELMQVSLKEIKDTFHGESNHELVALIENQTKIILGLTDMLTEFSIECEELTSSLRQDKKLIEELEDKSCTPTP